jgi:hypothetical protein
MGFREEQKAAEQQEAYEAFKLNYRGGGDVETAWRTAQAIADVEARPAKRREPNKAAVKQLQDLLNDAVYAAASFRGEEDFSAEERQDLVNKIMKDAEGIPAQARAQLREQIGMIVTKMIEDGGIEGSAQVNRAAAYRIAQDLPRTYEAPDGKMPAEELKSIMDQVPRA